MPPSWRSLNGDAGELDAFAALQARLPELYTRQFSDPLVPRSVVVVPSLTFDVGELMKIDGVNHYEERMLCMLMLLRLPRTQVVYVTSQRIDPAVIDYQLHLLADVPVGHARARLHLFACNDASPTPLTQKLLARPRLLDRIKRAIGDPRAAHLACFTSTPLERSLAVRLGIPLYGCDPALLALGTKSGSRELFRAAGVPTPAGYEHLRDEPDVVEALGALKRACPTMDRAVVKLEEGFSGEGNAVFSFAGAEGDLDSFIRRELPRRLRFEASGERWESYRAKLEQMGGVVERFIDGPDKRSPSVQYRIDPTGTLSLVSSHDQVLGGDGGQVFLGCRFPADAAYRGEIQALGARAGALLRREGVIGRISIDFVSVKEGDAFVHYAVEINLRKGGTTHPFMMLQYLTDGALDSDSGLFRTPSGEPRYYYATDNVQKASYCGLLPEDLIDIVVEQGIHFRGTTQQGVVFHLISAASEFGKLGMVCIGDSPDEAERLYRRTLEVLDAATGAGPREQRPADSNQFG